MNNPTEAVIELLIAALKDTVAGELTQFQMQFQHDDGKMYVARIVVVPEKMKHTWPSVAPAGTPQS